MEKPVCRRCLLSEVGESELWKSVTDYLQSLDPESKAPLHIYQERLDRCRSCDYLRNGMCRLCGCFVEVRAAKRLYACPDTPARW